MLACFTKAATIEYPYAPQLGAAACLQGQPAISQYLHRALQGMSALVFSQFRLAHSRGAGRSLGGGALRSAGAEYWPHLPPELCNAL